MFILSENIKKYRILNHLTQIELGEKLHVSGQAVSKWEKGSMPDAEIIPQIADVLNVSIDTLYGHKTSEKEDIFEAIIKEFDNKDDNRFDKAYQMAWLSALAAFSPKSVMELIGRQNPVITKTNGLENLAQLSSKWGYMIGNLTIDSQFMMLVKKRECFKDLVMQKEDYVSLFELLASEKVIDILLFLGSLDKETYVVLDVISKNVGLSVKETKKYLDRMCEYHLLEKHKLLSEESISESYTLVKDGFILSLLILAKEVYSSNIMLINIDDSFSK